MNRLSRVCLFSFLLPVMNASPVDPQSSGFELDHFFVAVPGPESGFAAVEAAGFTTSPSHPHPGQGTASRGVCFENAYLEFIWLTDPNEAASTPIRRTRLSERIDPSSGVCPFGIGLRQKGDMDPKLPFQTWDYRPPYLPEGLSFQMSESSMELGEPLVFFLPWLSGPGRPPEEHPNGARRVTELRIVLQDGAAESETLAALSEASVATFRSGSGYFMEIELDGGRSGKSLDLRPETPLRIKW